MHMIELPLWDEKTCALEEKAISIPVQAIHCLNLEVQTRPEVRKDYRVIPTCYDAVGGQGYEVTLGRT